MLYSQKLNKGISYPVDRMMLYDFLSETIHKKYLPSADTKQMTISIYIWKWKLNHAMFRHLKAVWLSSAICIEVTWFATHLQVFCRQDQLTGSQMLFIFYSMPSMKSVSPWRTNMNASMEAHLTDLFCFFLLHHHHRHHLLHLPCQTFVLKDQKPNIAKNIHVKPISNRMCLQRHFVSGSRSWINLSLWRNF